MFGKYQMNRVRINNNISYFNQTSQFTPSIPLFEYCIFEPKIMKRGGQRHKEGTAVGNSKILGE